MDTFCTVEAFELRQVLGDGDNSRTPDFNREIFLLKRFGTDWKFILYTFTTQPRRGEQ